MSLPAGSFKCDRLVKSSLASSMDGFINGGSESLPFSKASSETSTVFSCRSHDGQHTAGLGSWALRKDRSGGGDPTYLFILEFEHQGDLVTIYGLLGHLRGHPALGGVGLPGACSDIVIRRHGDGSLSGLVEGGTGRRGKLSGCVVSCRIAP